LSYRPLYFNWRFLGSITSFLILPANGLFSRGLPLVCLGGARFGFESVCSWQAVRTGSQCTNAYLCIKGIMPCV